MRCSYEIIQGFFAVVMYHLNRCFKQIIEHVFYANVFFSGRPFVKRFALCYRTVVCLSCPVLSCLSVCLTLVYCGQTVGWIKMKLGMEVGLILGHTVRWGPDSPHRGTAPHFRPMSVVAKRSPISAGAEHLFK